MTKFAYRALDPDGKAIEDTMEAPSAHAATRKLQERGLTVNSLEEAFPEKGLLRVSRRLRWEDLQLLSEQLASIIRSGLPLVPSLQALAKDLRHPRLKPVLEGLHQDLDRGTALEDAIARQHDHFPPMYPALIRAGEASGDLPGVLGLISEHATRIVDLKHRVQAAMIYPLILAVVSLAILVFLLVKVVPVFESIFSELGGSLPAPTRLLVAMSHGVQNTGPTIAIAVLIALIGGVVLWSQLLRTQRGRCQLELFRLYAPWFGPAYHVAVQARFFRMMSLLLASRVPVLDAIELAAAGSGSPVLERASEEAVLSVASGENLSDALKGTEFFGHDALWLMATSEARGRIDEAFESLANRYEREVATQDQMAGAVLGPAFAIGLGCMVAFITISLYLPIFTLGDQIGG